MTTQDTASYDGLNLHATRHYEHPEPHSETFHLRTVQFDDPDCVYWLAVGGKVYALAVIVGKGQTCIASVEDMLCQALGNRNAYTIWKPQAHSRSAFERWSKKWSARTA